MPRNRLRPSTATAISILTNCRHSARNPSAAPAGGRCRARTLPADRRARSDRRRRAPATARASTSSQSSIVMRAVRPLGHDLHGAAVGAGDAHPHQTVAEALEHRLDDRGDAGRRPCSTIRRGSAPAWCRSFRSFAALRSVNTCFIYFSAPTQPWGRSGNKKERVPGGPLSKTDRTYEDPLQTVCKDARNIAI